MGVRLLAQVRPCRSDHRHKPEFSESVADSFLCGSFVWPENDVLNSQLARGRMELAQLLKGQPQALSSVGRWPLSLFLEAPWPVFSSRCPHGVQGLQSWGPVLPFGAALRLSILQSTGCFPWLSEMCNTMSGDTEVSCFADVHRFL